jgi:FtsP/CotA-like multicopper oxidase with cupredoxin domain
MAHMSMVAVPTGPRVCTVLGRGEIWELVNWTSETHNFHIHQGKFRLAASGDPGLTPDFKTAVIGEDASKSPVMKFFSSTADPSNDVQAWHDTLPVPPRVQIDDSHFTPGRVFVFIPFVAKEQLGSFVFHCHILEHEDQGMMADIQVVEPVRPRTAAAY